MNSINVTPGLGDGSQSDRHGAFRVEIIYNTSHPHLPGDFVRRSEEGDCILMSYADYTKLVQGLDCVSLEYPPP